MDYFKRLTATQQMASAQLQGPIRCEGGKTTYTDNHFYSRCTLMQSFEGNSKESR